MSVTEDEGRGRLGALDTVRVLMVFCVVALHAAMTYMAYAVPWWYVLDSGNSLFFTVLVVYLDSFPMTSLFFLSGYFAPLSLAKRTRRAFIRDKLKHIGIPWIFGVLLVAPFFAAATMKAFLPVPPPFEFLREEFFGRFYQQAHYWYLGVLLFFLIAWVFTEGRKKSEPRTSPRGALTPSLFVLIWAFSTAVFCFSARYVTPADEWINIGYILYFQPARIAGYASIFALGVYGGKRGWFTQAGWQPGLAPWTALAAVSSCLFLLWKFVCAGSLGDAANLFLGGALYNLTALSMPFCLIALFTRARDRLTGITRRFSPASYPTYWLHQIVLMPLLYAMLNLRIPIGLKWAIGVVGTITICQALSRFVLMRLPKRWRIF